MRSIFFSLLTSLVLLSSIAGAQQVDVLSLTSTTLDKNAKASNSKVYIHEHMVRTETDGKDHMSTMLFDAEAETIYILNDKKKKYIEMTRQDMEGLSAMLREQMEMLEQQLAMLPQAQREAFKKSMGAVFNGHQETVEYEKEASDTAVKKWKADKYVGTTEDGRKQSEIYLASYQELGQDQQNFKSLEKFFSLMQEFAQSMSRNLPTSGLAIFGEGLPAYEGKLPVKTVFYDEKGEISSTSSIDSIEEERVEEALFSIPENYKKENMSQAFME